MIYVIPGIICSYLLGSFPAAYVYCRLFKKIDIREYGSGNVGATNVYRTVGKIPGIMIFIIDFLKGFLSVTLIPYLLEKYSPSTDTIISKYVVFFGAAAIAGHIWTIFLKFKGGKGVASTGGVMAGIAPVIMLISFIVWLVFVFIWKYISLASIAAAVSLPVLALIMGKDLQFIIFSAILCSVGVYAHRSNIKRLIQGAEKKIVKDTKVQKKPIEKLS